MLCLKRSTFIFSSVIPGLTRDLLIKKQNQHTTNIYGIPCQARGDSFGRRLTNY
ncbi:MAG: hypothetical protein JWP12_1076 [Bacteroidetes bacterium]|nr:hypothetical protein [Bacteroidota bacterium]